MVNAILNNTFVFQLYHNCKLYCGKMEYLDKTTDLKLPIDECSGPDKSLTNQSSSTLLPILTAFNKLKSMSEVARDN